ncbi:MAG: M23 family metallopeptidase [Anaerolineaceae bacterium]
MLSLLEKIQSVQMGAETGSDMDSVKIPVTGAELTQAYNAGHHGLDFGVVEGTPVRSTMSGNVVYSGWNDQGYGNLVIVENGSKRTYYAHLSELPVIQGEWINQGDVIGLSGNTGNSTGPHLHYEIRINGQTIDPSEEVFSGNNPTV